MRGFLPFAAPVILSATVGILSASSAQAQSFTTFDEAIVASQPVSFTQSVNLKRFDASLGQLTGITISLSANALASLDVENRTNNPSGDLARSLDSFSLSVPVRVTGPNGLSLTATTVSDSAAFSTFTSPVTLQPGDMKTYVGPTVYQTASANIPLSGFSAYTGSGSETVTLSLSGRNALLTDVEGSTGITYTPRANAGGTVRITYTYTNTAVPEPGALGLMVAGLAPVAVGGIRRRRK